ncbi:LTA synthase family protein [Streptococcus sp. E24BD]|uniref:LTA synthase family protein n=1 Tax=Streptococcus sp. E24BD TaxID=3278715 RepID=UPI00359D7F83
MFIDDRQRSQLPGLLNYLLLNRSNLATLAGLCFVALASIPLFVYQVLQSLLELDITSRHIQLLSSQWLFPLCLGIVALATALSSGKWLFQLLKLAFVYYLYPLLSGLVTTAYYVNDPEANLKELASQSHHQHLLLLFSLLIGLGVICHRFLPRFSFVKGEIVSDLALAVLFALLPLQDGRLLTILSPNFMRLLDDGMTVSQGIWQVFLPIYVVFVILAYALTRGLSGLRQNRGHLGLALFTSFASAVVLNLALQEAYRGDGSYYGYIMAPGAMSFQITFFTLTFLMIYLLVNRYFLGTLLILPLAAIIAVANEMKFTMRAEPLLITDIAWVKELSFLAGFIAPATKAKLIIGLLLAVGAYIFLRRCVLKGKLVRTWIGRISLAVAFLLFFNHISSVFKKEEHFKVADNVPIISRLNNELDLNWLGFDMAARYKSLAFVWVKQLTKPVMDKPEQYSQETLADLEERYRKEAEQINEDRQNRLEDQTVIFVLSESLANPERIEGINLSKPALPYITSLTEQTTGGLMWSDFYGGGTANLEFQSLTGLAYELYSPSVSILYTEVVPKMNYLPSISRQYAPDQRFVIHPYGATGYNRSVFYNSLTFEKFLALSGSKDSIENPEYLGVHISDKTTYDNVLNLLDKDQSQFFSVITMQNHAPWSASEPAAMTAQGPAFTEAENNNLTSYARLLSHTDLATKDFLEKLSTFDQTVTVVFYGDHLPGLYPLDIFKDQPDNQHLTDYFIWTNRDPKRRLNYPKVGANNFIAELLEHTNSKVTPYQALLTRYLQEVSSQTSNLTEEQEVVRRDMQLLQYDITVGKGYLSRHKDFFEVKGGRISRK